MGRHNPCFSPLSLCCPETQNPIACLLYWLSWPGKRTHKGLWGGRTRHIKCVCLTWGVMKTPRELGQWSLSYLGWSWRKLFCFPDVECRRWVRVARGAAPLFYCGACTESGCIHTQLLSFEGIWSTLVLFGSALFTFSSLTSPPISVFSAPAFLLENKCKLAFSHPLTVTVLFMHIVLFQVFVLLGSLYTVVLFFFFPLKVWISLEIGAWRFILWGYRLFVMTSYQNLCNHSSGT